MLFAAEFQATLPANQQELWFTFLGVVASFVAALLKPKVPALASLIDSLLAIFQKKPVAPAPVTVQATSTVDPLAEAVGKVQAAADVAAQKSREQLAAKIAAAVDQPKAVA